MKRTLTAVTFTFFLLITGTAQTQAQTIKINGGGISTGRAYIKTEIKGHKLTVRTPKLSKNKYLKLVNVAL